MWVVIALFATLIVSIFFGGIALLGSIPYVSQHLADKPKGTVVNIYDQKGGLKSIWSPQLSTLWALQYRLFAASMILFGFFAIWR